MGRLKERDIADVVDCLRDAYALTDIDTFAAQLISRLRKVLVCNGILFGNCDLHNMRSEFVADHPDASEVYPSIKSLRISHAITNIPIGRTH